MKSPGSTSHLPILVVSGDLRRKEVYKWHEKAKSLAKAGFCQYAFRHYLKTKAEATVPLCGYGMELALNNTEYKVMDDSSGK